MNVEQEQHNIEIRRNLEYWRRKPVLQAIYAGFYNEIARHIDFEINGDIVELGSGIGNLKSVVPGCICTDMFDNPWLDRVENAYRLTFPDQSVSHLILFDVFHHIRYPGTLLEEFRRVLVPGGRVIIFEPALSALGLLVYGVFHHEAIGRVGELCWNAPENFDCENTDYYAAQGNAGRIFFSRRYKKHLSEWNILLKKKFAAISYVLSGGYGKPQLFPSALYPVMKGVDKLCGLLPFLFATRALVVLEK
ncbi:MAG: class I SAM-dependent methyltransferase [bacterium]|nr:class I SAM-dependent methyltransferase [bacterium]